MDILFFADASVSFDGRTFSDLALAGDKGVIIALIIAYIALILVFAGLHSFSAWCEARRYERKEIEREKELVRLRTEENAGRERLVQAQSELAGRIQELAGTVGAAAAEVRRIGEKVDRLESVWES
ncbi:MAG: hypothetical protein IJJ20_03585 [Thermoguttaceae bacterium]|nr:hypothetical protein [Thermoguttaceae bacterium]